MDNYCYVNPHHIKLKPLVKSTRENLITDIAKYMYLPFKKFSESLPKTLIILFIWPYSKYGIITKLGR